MARRDSVEVAKVLAQLAKLEQDVLDNLIRAEEFSDDEYGQRRFFEGEISALRGAQKLIRELADWPVKETPLLVNWPPPEESSDQLGG